MTGGGRPPVWLAGAQVDGPSATWIVLWGAGLGGEPAGVCVCFCFQWVQGQVAGQPAGKHLHKHTPLLALVALVQNLLC